LYSVLLAGRSKLRKTGRKETLGGLGGRWWSKPGNLTGDGGLALLLDPVHGLCADAEAVSNNRSWCPSCESQNQALFLGDPLGSNRLEQKARQRERTARARDRARATAPARATARAGTYVCSHQDTGCQDIVIVGDDVVVEVEYCLHLRGKEEGC
jgi:hypothetical protein